MLMDDVRGELVLRRLPPDILQGLTQEQVIAIRRAGGFANPRRHPVDARFGMRLPLLGHCYLVVLIGKELRSSSRLKSERSLRAADRIGTIVLLLLGASAFLLAALIGALFQNAIISR